MKSVAYIAIIVLSACFLDACSTKNSAFLNRAYHNTTARYNGYFNARQSIKEGLRTYNEGRKDDLDTLMPLFTRVDDDASSLFPAMDKAIKKSNQVIIDHSIEIRGEEFNRWVDENYYCIARAHFYKGDYNKATEVLAFSTKKYPDRKGIIQHYSLLVRTFLKNENATDASIYLGELNKLKDLKRKEALLLQKTNAHFNIYQKSYEKAAEHIEIACTLERKKSRRFRLKFLLAQLYNLSGQGTKAIPILAEISKKSTDYDLAFAAVMLQAKSVDNKVAGYAVKKRLEDMLKDKKNLEYKDQIYFALAEIEWAELNFPKGLEYLNLSIANSIDNEKQKAKSFNKIANYYYAEKNYQKAKLNYDSAIVYMGDGVKKEGLEALLVNLDVLVKELNTIDKNDSLIAIYNLSPEEQQKKLERVKDKLIRDEKKKLEDQKKLAAQKAKLKSKGNKLKGNWYFYNDNAKSQGQKEFLKKWGDRPLADNWRVKSKLEQGAIGNTSEESPEATIIASKVPSISELKANLPTSNADVAQLQNQTMMALYESGIIYKENFEDFDNSIEAYENLLSRFDTTSLKLNVCYQLYRLYLKKENQSKKSFFAFDSKSSSFYYEDLILNDFPESEFAQLIKNPSYLQEKAEDQAEEANIYTDLYKKYLNQPDSLNRKMLDRALEEELMAAVGSKVLFLSARLAANMRDTTRLLADLNNIVNNYTQEPVYDPALAMKKRLDSLLNIKDDKSAEDPKDKTTPDTNAVAAKEIFKEDVNGTQYYLIICPKALKININDLKNEVAKFNDVYFSNTPLTVNHSFIDNENQIVLIKTFSSEKEAEKYYKTIQDQRTGAMQIVGTKKLVHFPITTQNFISLFKTKDVNAYKDFFIKNYNL